LPGAILLALSSGALLWGRWRTAENDAAFHEDGDVAFALAVFLLMVLIPIVLAAAQRPSLLLLVPLAVIPARTFVRTLRPRR